MALGLALRPRPGTPTLHFCRTSSFPAPPSYLIILIGVPYRIRTGVAAVRGRCPGPLDEGDEASGLISLDAGMIKHRCDRWALVAKIQILQGLLDLQAADEGDRRLKIVALLAGDAQFVAL